MRTSRALIAGFLGISCGPSTPDIDEDEHEGEGAPRCGDGVLDPDEACDDGNLRGGDGCSRECVHSGTHLECVTLTPLFEGRQDLDARALVESLAGSFIAAGSVGTELGYAAWIGRFDEQGQPRWVHELESYSGLLERAYALVPDGEGGAWVLVGPSAGTTIVHFDVQGEAVGAVDVLAAAGMLPWVATMVSSPTALPTQIWLGGASEGDAWVGRLDGQSGTIATIMLDDYAGYDDVVRAIGHHEDRLAVAATVSTTPNADGDQPLTAQTDILLVEFDMQGVERSRVLLGPGTLEGYARHAGSVVRQAEGWAVGGWQQPLAVLDPFEVWVAGPAFGPAEWGSGAVLPGSQTATFAALLASEASVVVSGSRVRDGHFVGWLAGIDAEGEMIWEHVEPDELGSHEEGSLFIDAAGRVRAIERVSRSGSAQLRSCILAI